MCLGTNRIHAKCFSRTNPSTYSWTTRRRWIRQLSGGYWSRETRTRTAWARRWIRQLSGRYWSRETRTRTAWARRWIMQLSGRYWSRETRTRTAWAMFCTKDRRGDKSFLVLTILISLQRFPGDYSWYFNTGIQLSRNLAATRRFPWKTECCNFTLKKLLLVISLFCCSWRKLEFEQKRLTFFKHFNIPFLWTSEAFLFLMQPPGYKSIFKKRWHMFMFADQRAYTRFGGTAHSLQESYDTQYLQWNKHCFSCHSTQAQPPADQITYDRIATKQKLNHSRNLKSDESLNKLEGKSRTLINTAKVVKQVTNVKMFLTSFKKDSEYVFVEIPKRPDGKKRWFVYLFISRYCFNLRRTATKFTQVCNAHTKARCGRAHYTLYWSSLKLDLSSW